MTDHELGPLPEPPSLVVELGTHKDQLEWAAYMRSYALAEVTRAVAAEREACAKLCDGASDAFVGVLPGGAAACAGLAFRIRARGQA